MTRTGPPQSTLMMIAGGRARPRAASDGPQRRAARPRPLQRSVLSRACSSHALAEAGAVGRGTFPAAACVRHGRWCVQALPGKRTHKRTGSAPPNMSPSSLLTSRPGKDRSSLLSNIPEEPEEAERSPPHARPSVRFNSHAAAMSELSHADASPPPPPDSHSSVTTLSPRGEPPVSAYTASPPRDASPSAEPRTPVPPLNLSPPGIAARSASLQERNSPTLRPATPVLTPSQSFQQGYQAAMQEHATSLSPPAWHAAGPDAWSDARYSSTVIHPGAQGTAMPPELLAGGSPPPQYLGPSAPTAASPWQQHWQHLWHQQQRAAQVISQLQQHSPSSPATTPPGAPERSPAAQTSSGGRQTPGSEASSGVCTAPSLSVLDAPPAETACVSPAQSPHEAHAERSHASEMEADEPSSAVLHDLEAVWCNHQKLHLMVQTLKSALLRLAGC